MEHIRIDAEGNLRCSNCGGKNFEKKKTIKGKVAPLIPGYSTKRLKCLACKEYHKAGNPVPYETSS